ncbi:Os07g0452100, partial [Oryza sativa Japonica Group]
VIYSLKKTRGNGCYFIMLKRNRNCFRTIFSSRTCSKTMPGSLGYEDIDAKTFASWVIRCTELSRHKCHM